MGGYFKSYARTKVLLNARLLLPYCKSLYVTELIIFLTDTAKVNIKIKLNHKMDK